ncbi:serine/threonine protein phosphatase 5 phosphatase [Cryptococcus neoformans Tu401-1]|nr:serine/threonine protein phosphatase 5 phosphatase [Cryptococcus neoformans var. grubii Bt85]OXG21738.1 serine/threonine protein phosphatase 5 phosphatase [Cryptococcus neoformans var. grubii Tu401-1]
MSKSDNAQNPPSSFTLPPQLLAQAADAYRHPAPPPQLPAVQLVPRHQEPVINPKEKHSPNGYPPNGAGVGIVRCPEGRAWQERNMHAGERLGRFRDQDIDGFVADMAMVLRKEYDCWVEQCWQEAFHQVFTHTLPDLIINLIMTGATPSFLRRNIVFGGQSLDHLFQSQMLHILFEELELCLSGDRPRARTEPGPSTSPTFNNGARPSPFPLPPQPAAAPIFRDGVCFHNLSFQHGIPEEEDDHGSCLCQLTSCMVCFHLFAIRRRGPISLLPHELLNTPAAKGWLGGIETEAHARARQDSLRRKAPSQNILPPGKGYAQVPKPGAPAPTAPNGNAEGGIGEGGGGKSLKPPQIFPHPQMTDVLAVEEHLRWRLKELGATDPAVEGRYGPSTNSPVALEGIELPQGAGEESDDGGQHPTGEGAGGKVNMNMNSAQNKNVKLAKVKGRGKMRRVVVPNGVTAAAAATKTQKQKEKDGKTATVYLPKEWMEAAASERNTAIVLTFRHFVKLLHQIAMAASPFSHPDYPSDIEELLRMHPIALYRRLTESAMERRYNAEEVKAWKSCMDKWAEEFGGKERKKGNDQSQDKRHSEAVRHYTRAISLDPKKTVYYSNRAIAYNNLSLHSHAEIDCTHLLARDPKNQKALYQRALARRGMGRWTEAQSDLQELLRLSGDNESAKNLLMIINKEMGRL